LVLHADNQKGAIDHIALLAPTSGGDLEWPVVSAYVRRIIATAGRGAGISVRGTGG
jgi:hypothetical protein